MLPAFRDLAKKIREGIQGKSTGIVVDKFNLSSEKANSILDKVGGGARTSYTSSGHLAFDIPTVAYTARETTCGLWHLTEGSGTSAADVSGNGNTLTLSTGTSIWDAAAKFGTYALDLSTTKYATCTLASVEPINYYLFVSAWVNGTGKFFYWPGVFEIEVTANTVIATVLGETFTTPTLTIAAGYHFIGVQFNSGNIYIVFDNFVFHFVSSYSVLTIGSYAIQWGYSGTTTVDELYIDANVCVEDDIPNYPPIGFPSDVARWTFQDIKNTKVTAKMPGQPTVTLVNCDKRMPWYNTSWTKRVRFTVNHSYVSEDLTNFPIYMNETNMPSNFFSNIQSNGNDILITSGDGVTKLSHEIVSINSAGGTIELHFKAPSLSATYDKVFYLYYGNSTCASQQNVSDVWSNGYVGVWHLTETSGNFLDSTANNLYGTNSVSQTGKTGKLYSSGGQQFDSNDYISIADNALLDLTSNITMECWINPDSPLPSIMNIIYRVNTYWFYWSSSDGRLSASIYQSASAKSSTAAAGTITATQWQSIAMTWDRNDGTRKIKLYKNGNETSYISQNAANNADIDNTSNALRLGYFSNSIVGYQDEVRLSSVTRTAGWLLSQYNNQNSPGTFYTYSASESTEAETRERTCILLNGSTSYATATLNTEYPTYLTIEAYVKFASVASAQTILDQTDGLNLSFDGTGFQGGTYNIANPTTQIATFTPVVNRWYLISLVYDGVNKYIYIDGNLAGQLASAPLGTLQFGGTLYIGRTVAGTQYFNGYIGFISINRSVLRPYNRIIPPFILGKFGFDGSTEWKLS